MVSYVVQRFLMCLKFSTGEISGSTPPILTGFNTSVTSSPDAPFRPVIYQFARKYAELTEQTEITVYNLLPIYFTLFF